MTTTEVIDASALGRGWGRYLTPGLLWLVLACLGAGLFFWPGLESLVRAWSRPEYSHGPLIPVLSALLWMRQLKTVPVNPGPVTDRWVGVWVVLAALALGGLGRIANISDIVAYATILWVGGLVLISFGWRNGWQFWPPVLHLVYMLPLPTVLYFKLSTWLQHISSELGVWMLRLLDVPVFLEGNIIDLGVMQLHVAEACSGLRYLFPILSFSYIFAVLYRGPMWHKAVLLVSAVPITVFMNSVRIAIGGLIANVYGVEWLDGFSHFFEGWVIFVACIVILFALARLMLFLHPSKMGLAQALDLEIEGVLPQLRRLQLVEASRALMLASGVGLVLGLAWLALPERAAFASDRDGFAVFPRTLGDWRQAGRPEVLTEKVEAALKADDYHSITLVNPAQRAEVGLFMAWYQDQGQGGVHTPEVCLPSSGWEIAWLERVDIAPRLGMADAFELNRAIIQKGTTRMMVYYWFEQKGRRVAWDFAAKMYLVWDGITTGRTDGGIVRLTTLILPGESDEAAALRLDEVLGQVIPTLPRFMPAD